MWWIVTLISFVVQQYQASQIRQQQAQARDEAARRADAAKGTMVVVSGESAPLKILYGRNLVGGIRVYHNSFNDYTYAYPAAGGASFSASSLTETIPTAGSQVSGPLQADATIYVSATTIPTSDIGMGATGVDIVLTKTLPAGTHISGIATTSTVAGYGVSVLLAADSEIQSIDANSSSKMVDGTVEVTMLNPFNFTDTQNRPFKLNGFAKLSAPASIMITDKDAMRNNAAPALKNHEYLITQQVLGFAGIHACYSIDIDNRKLIGECNNEFNEIVYPNNASPDAFKGLTPDADGWYAKSAITSYFDDSQLAKITNKGIQHINPYKDTCVVHFYGNACVGDDGALNTADPLIVANDVSRTNAFFTNAAYATTAYRWDRENPAYNGVPNAQFYIEGMRVKGITGSKGARTLTSNKTYSNNPALCLLDYLTNKVYGKGLDISEIDLDSFYDAYVVCERVVMPGVPLEGNFWRTKGGTRDIKLYECNLALESSNSFRKNIETLLECMNGAELVWTSGQYKLQLMYPHIYDQDAPYNTGEIVQWSEDGLTDKLYKSLVDGNTSLPNTASWETALAAIITDDHINRSGETSISWPNASTRFNYATVRFANEAKDFVEDQVFWPPKNDPANTVYATYLAEDNGIELSTDVYGTGITSYYAALAKAEWMVRNSREAVTYNLTVARDLLFLEPGDVIRVESKILDIPGEILRVGSVQPDFTTGELKLGLTKYDAWTLAWNVADDEPGDSRNIYRADIAQALNLKWRVRTKAERIASGNNAYGELTWDAPKDARVTGYYVGYTTVPKAKVVRGTHYEVLGETAQLKMLSSEYIPDGKYTVGVVSHAANGKIAPQFGRNSRWPLIEITINNVPQVTGLAVNIYDTPEEIAAAALLPNKSVGVLTWDMPDSPRVKDFIAGYTPMTKERWLQGPPWPAEYAEPTKRYPIQQVCSTNSLVLGDIPPGHYSILVACRDAAGKLSTEWNGADDHFAIIDFKIGEPFQAINLQVREFSAAEAAKYPGSPFGILTWDPPPGGPHVKDYIVGYTPMTAEQFLAGPPWPAGFETVEARYPFWEVVPTTSFLLPSTVADGTYTLGVAARGDDGTLALEWDDSVTPVSHWPVISVTKGPLLQPVGLAYHKYTAAESAALVTPAWGKITWSKPSDTRVTYFTIGYIKGTVANNQAAYLAAHVEDHADITVTEFPIPLGMPPGTYTVGVMSRDAQGNSSPMWYEGAPYSAASPSKIPLITVVIDVASVSNLTWHAFTVSERISNGGNFGKLSWAASTEVGVVDYMVNWKVKDTSNWLGPVFTHDLYLIVPEMPSGTYTVAVGTRNKDGAISASGTWQTLDIIVTLPSNVTGLGFIAYDAATRAANGGASGKVYWDASTDPRVVDYVLGYKTTGDWLEWTSVKTPYWVAPAAPPGTYTVGVATRDKDGVLSAQPWPTVTVTLTSDDYSEKTTTYSSQSNVPSGATVPLYITVPVGYTAYGLAVASASILNSTTPFTASLALFSLATSGIHAGSYIAYDAAKVYGTMVATADKPASGTLSTQASFTNVQPGTYQVWADAVVTDSGPYGASGSQQPTYLSVSITLKKDGM